MRWPWSTPSANVNLDVSCPDCQSVLPKYKALELTLGGARLICQAKNCGCQFSVGPAGVFKHDPEALPWTGKSGVPEPRAESMAPEEENGREREPERFYLAGKPKPRV